MAPGSTRPPNIGCRISRCSHHVHTTMKYQMSKFQLNELHRDSRVLSRPSATSQEYEGHSSSKSNVSIHNIIEQQSWEHRVGISNAFDPERRGYTFSRDARGGGEGRGGGGAGMMRISNNNQHEGRERSRERFRERSTERSREHNGTSHENAPERYRGDEDRRSYYNQNDNQNSHQRGRGADKRNLGGYGERCHRDQGLYNDNRGREQQGIYHRPCDSIVRGYAALDPRESRSHSIKHVLNHRHSRGGYSQDRYQQRLGGYSHGQDRSQFTEFRGDQGQLSTGSSQPSDNYSWETVPSRNKRNRGRGSNRNGDRDGGRNSGGNGDVERPAPRIALIPQNTSNSNFPQFMLMLTGIPGSGKSSFAQSLVAGKPWMYVRVNQDALGSRGACEALAHSVLQDGKCPIIDRCNFNPQQRSHFLDIAKSFNVPVDCVVFQFDMDLCVRRCQNRRNHETIAPAEARGIVMRMQRDYSPPLPSRINSETFRSIKTLSDQASFNDLVMEFLNHDLIP